MPKTLELVTQRERAISVVDAHKLISAKGEESLTQHRVCVGENVDDRHDLVLWLPADIFANGLR